MAGNRRAVKYYVFYPGGFKNNPIFIVADSSTTHPDDLMIRVIKKTPHVIIRVTRAEIIEIITDHLRRNHNRYFNREDLQRHLIDVKEFEKMIEYQLSG